jgi:hypothetical protein
MVDEHAYVERRGTPEAMYHAPAPAEYGMAASTRCGHTLTTGVPLMLRDWAARDAAPCPECYPGAAR